MYIEKKLKYNYHAVRRLRKKTSLFKSGAGFTLIELLIYLTLVTGILISATTFAWNIINSRTKAFAIQEVEQNGRLIMERIIQEVHQAGKVNTPTGGNSSSKLSLAMRNTQQDPTMFLLNGTQLYLSHGVIAPVAISTDDVLVTSLIFRNLSNSSGTTRNIEIELVLEHRNPDHRQEWQARETFTTMVELRDIY
jgi:type II secretory pathway pseudopilin PulG